MEVIEEEMLLLIDEIVAVSFCKCRNWWNPSKIIYTNLI